VGLLLVSAMMVVPVAAAQQVTRGFRTTMTVAMAIGVGAAVAGFVVSAEVNTAPGATIVLLALAVFVLLATGSAVWRVRPRRAEELEPPDVVLHG
jgi:zinc transport system permease protein